MNMPWTIFTVYPPPNILVYSLQIPENMSNKTNQKVQPRKDYCRRDDMLEAKSKPKDNSKRSKTIIMVF